jgi:hypothetical protein
MRNNRTVTDRRLYFYDQLTIMSGVINLPSNHGSKIFDRPNIFRLEWLYPFKTISDRFCPFECETYLEKTGTISIFFPMLYSLCYFLAEMLDSRSGVYIKTCLVGNALK